MVDPLVRCPWGDADDLMRGYHDREWGVPERDSRKLWEKLILDGFQAGLSWRTILARREGFRQAFDGFDPERVAAYGPRDVERLLADAAIIRSRSKIDATIRNARAYLAMRDAGEDLARRRAHRLGGPGATEQPPVRAGVEGLAEPRLHLRRTHHRLRLDGGHRPHQQPCPRLLPARGNIPAALARQGLTGSLADSA
jgi:hypothetical protein